MKKKKSIVYILFLMFLQLSCSDSNCTEVNDGSNNDSDIKLLISDTDNMANNDGMTDKTNPEGSDNETSDISNHVIPDDKTPDISGPVIPDSETPDISNTVIPDNETPDTSLPVITDEHIEDPDVDFATEPFVPTGYDPNNCKTSSLNITPIIPPAPIAQTDLISHWKLNGDWKDAVGSNDLTPVTVGGFTVSDYVMNLSSGNQSYGPTGRNDNNGASGSSNITVDMSKGITIEGWVQQRTSIEGILFGIVDSSSNGFYLSFTNYGYITANYGDIKKRDIRLDDAWHHVALVYPANAKAGDFVEFYIDGVKASASLEVGSTVSKINAAPFKVATFIRNNAEDAKVDEVRLWNRPLTIAEIKTQSTHTGVGGKYNRKKTCDDRKLPMCDFQTVSPNPEVDLLIRVLSDDTIAIVSDPNPWLKARLLDDCGVYLRATETCAADPDYSIQEWERDLDYRYSVAALLVNYRPGILEDLGKNSHYSLKENGGDAVDFDRVSLWPTSSRQFRVKRAVPGFGEAHTGTSSEVIYFSYLKLDDPMVVGKSYTVSDEWGNTKTVKYEGSDHRSWAIKTNQVGYMPDAKAKYAYMGVWLGGSGKAMDLSRFNGKSFDIMNVSASSSDAPAFTGTITARPTSTTLIRFTGEKVYEMDFSTFNTEGEYYIRVEGLGRSFPFVISQNVMGEAFYIHARGVFQKRGGKSLNPKYTNWPRINSNEKMHLGKWPILQGNRDNFNPHCKESVPWGFMDKNGNCNLTAAASLLHPFKINKHTLPDTVLVEVAGGWHDAADDDRRELHLGVVRDLVHPYLFFPKNFTDNQLNIPESGNGIPDILDEAAHGIDVWMQAQEAMPEKDGRTPVAMETSGHATSKPWFSAIATKNSSLMYAAHAALLGRAFKMAGANTRAKKYIDSAVRAYNFGVSSKRAKVDLNLEGQEWTWTGPPKADPKFELEAIIELWLATGEQKYRDELDRADIAQIFMANTEVFKDHDEDVNKFNGYYFNYVDIALNPEKFPANWGVLVEKIVDESASYWLEGQKANSYRKLWRVPGSKNSEGLGWGNGGYNNIRAMITAWKVTGEVKYKTAAINGVDWMMGVNPMGISYTTGLGHYHISTLLDDQSLHDGIEDPVPGLTLYSPTGGIHRTARQRVWGMTYEKRSDFGFDSSYYKAQLPPPWETVVTDSKVGSTIGSSIPIYRHMIMLEAGNVMGMEFTVWETVSRAVAVTGALMGEGWAPSEDLKNRIPKTTNEMKDMILLMP